MMRRIPLKTLDFIGPDGMPGKLTYAANIIGLAKAPTGGASLDEMDLALAIEAAVEAATECGAREVVLEEQHYAYFAERIRSARFTWVSKALRQFCRDILAAETFQPNAGDPTGRDPGQMMPRVGPVVTRHEPDAA
jgi:hypothetical protein